MFSNNIIGLKLKKIFGNNKDKTKDIILVEFFNYFPSLISFAYFIKILKAKYSAKVVCYQPYSAGFFNKLKFYFKSNYSSISYFYKCIGVQEFQIVNQNINSSTLKKLKHSLKKKIKKKEDILKIKVFNISVGNELYDQFLKDNNKTEVEIESREFDKCLNNLLITLSFWENYFKKYNIRSLIISHHVYFFALIAKIAMKLNIPVYCVGAQNFFLINKKNISKHSCCKSFPLSFKKIKKNKKKYLNFARKNLMSRFRGVVDKKLLLDQKTDHSLFKKNNKNLKLKFDNKKINILVAAHCFSDAIHAFGDNLYTDFHDWLEFLGKVSEKRNYKMYIKIHPAQYDRNYKHFMNFMNKYKNFIVLPKNTTVTQMLNKKFDYVLTVYGSVGHESPLFNTPVINASVNGPHSAYSFNLSPKNKKSYEKKILNLKKNNFKISEFQKKQIFEFYFMRYLSEYALLDKWDTAMTSLEDDYNSKKILEFYLKNFKKKSHLKKLQDLEKFIEKKALRLISKNENGISKLIGYIN